MGKKKKKPEETPCRNCKEGEEEKNFMIFCKQMNQNIVASNKFCRCYKFDPKHNNNN